MNIKPFAVEEWMNKWETGARYNIAETCVDSVSLDELFEITGEDKDAFLSEFCKKRLTYGVIEGRAGFRKGICRLYRSINEDEVITTHGAAGANHHVFYSLISPGDRVISIMPTYQQLYSIPESLGADVRIVELKKENDYLPDIESIRKLAADGVKMICINNPNNPTGALMEESYLRQIADIARDSDAYILCDEVYRHLGQDGEWPESVADIYEKGISVSSMSKVFSLAGLRLGWIATHDRKALDEMILHRDYDLVSCGMFDESVAELALRHSEKLLERNKKIVSENLRILDEWVDSEKHVSYVKPHAGTTALVYYDIDMDSYEFCEKMYHETGAFVTPGDCFEQSHSMRIGYACDTETLKKGLNAVSEFMKIMEEI